MNKILTRNIAYYYDLEQDLETLELLTEYGVDDIIILSKRFECLEDDNLIIKYILQIGNENLINYQL